MRSRSSPGESARPCRDREPRPHAAAPDRGHRPGSATSKRHPRPTRRRRCRSRDPPAGPSAPRACSAVRAWFGALRYVPCPSRAGPDPSHLPRQQRPRPRPNRRRWIRRRGVRGDRRGLRMASTALRRHLANAAPVTARASRTAISDPSASMVIRHGATPARSSCRACEGSTAYAGADTAAVPDTVRSPPRWASSMSSGVGTATLDREGFLPCGVSMPTPRGRRRSGGGEGR